MSDSADDLKEAAHYRKHGCTADPDQCGCLQCHQMHHELQDDAYIKRMFAEGECDHCVAYVIAMIEDGQACGEHIHENDDGSICEGDPNCRINPGNPGIARQAPGIPV